MSQAKIEERFKKFEYIEKYNRAILNILDDFGIEKEKLQNFRLAIFNILDDFDEKRMEVQLVQQATLNLLEDMAERRTAFEQTLPAFMNILEDIEIGREEVEDSKILLEQVNSELETFSYSVSHDLQAPLRAINGFSQALMEDHATTLNPEGQRFIGLIQKNSRLMGQLIQDLLLFSRLGRKKVSFTEINIEKLILEVFEELKSQTPTRKIELKLGSLPNAVGDSSMFRQVFVNLLSNAIKYTKNREVALIEVGYREEANKGCYYVKDNGAGFDMRYVDKLFGVFQRLHTADEFEGTGIGLALVKQIITRHKGKVWAEGAVDQGACFYFSIPEEGKDDRKSNR